MISRPTLEPPSCEICGKAAPRRDDILCSDCGRAYSLLSELVDDHPELALEDFDRLKQIFDWKSKKIKAIPA